MVKNKADQTGQKFNDGVHRIRAYQLKKNNDNEQYCQHTAHSSGLKIMNCRAAFTGTRGFPGDRFVY
jgi:hypothetical protein